MINNNAIRNAGWRCCVQIHSIGSKNRSCAQASHRLHGLLTEYLPRRKIPPILFCPLSFPYHKLTHGPEEHQRATNEKEKLKCLISM